MFVSFLPQITQNTCIAPPFQTIKQISFTVKTYKLQPYKVCLQYTNLVCIFLGDRDFEH